MKKLTVIPVLFVALTYLAGCGAYFGSTSGFKTGNWYGLASSEEAARITQRAMAMNKMWATTDSPKSKSRAEKINSSSATINLAELSRFAHLDSSGKTIIINLAKLSQLAPPDSSIKTVTINLKELSRLAHLDSPVEMVVINSEEAGQPSDLIDPIMGYKGIVANTDQYATINTIINGPETKSYLLPPGLWIEDYLIPGDYVAVSYYKGQKIGLWEFTVGLQTQSYMGKKVHWYTYCDL